MTKTAYAKRLSDEEVAEQTKDMAPEDREEYRIENATSPLFDMWLQELGARAPRARFIRSSFSSNSASISLAK